MKSLLYICIAAAVLTSCDKNDDDDDQGGTIPALYSTWQWHRSFGGISATTVTPAAGSTVLLSLTTNSYTATSNAPAETQSGSFNKTFSVSNTGDTTWIYHFDRMININNLRIAKDILLKK